MSNLINTMFDRTTAILAIAALWDYLLGDPPNWLHPVQVMGWVIRHYTQLVLAQSQLFKSSQPILLRLAGIGLAIGMILGSGLAGWVIVQFAHGLHPILGMAIEVLLLASCFAGRSLRAAATDVLDALYAENSYPENSYPENLHPENSYPENSYPENLNLSNLVIARSRLSQYVGRDTDQLSESEILRAVLETVTENATDGVMAPLFYAIVGSLFSGGLPFSLALPFAFAYKAASTLDSMVGYQEAPYTDLGWCSARLEDGLTWLPCRLHVLTLALISGQPRQVWQLCRRDAPQDPSPNAGWSECAYAAILGVQMGGSNQYRGVLKQKPRLGDPVYPITRERIDQAMHLTRLSFLLWLGLRLLLQLVN